jgi:hypothetical protein
MDAGASPIDMQQIKSSQVKKSSFFAMHVKINPDLSV